MKWSLLPTVIASVAIVTGNIGASLPAQAQSAPPPAPPGAAPAPTATTSEPPARVGWLSNLSGSVSFHSAGQDQWVTATQNYPVATGDAVWTQPQGAASVMVDATRIALSGGTELTAQEIDQTTITAALSQGEIFLNVVALQQGQTVAIETPRGTAQIGSNGEYEIYAGDSSTPTYVTTVTGSIQFTGLGSTTPQTVGAQQTVVVSGTNPVQAQLGAMQQDQFLTAMLQHITPPPAPTAAQAPAACAQMTGATVLSSYGTWQPQPSVGTVWFPQVASTWVPYREGRWAYVQPWGWTWVDNQPWGFAPFHYGRWAQFGGRWGWVPQPVAEEGYGYGGAYRPVYAPALVTFLGAAAGAFTAAAFASGAIGWAPLGPHEPYYPPYPVSQRYFGAYNRAYVPNYNQFYQRNVTIVNNRVSYRSEVINNYGAGSRPGEAFVNRQAATFVPRDAMLGSRPIEGFARPLPPNAQAQPFRPGAERGAEGLPRPTAGTWGVTPAFAQRERLAAAPAGLAPRPTAPGPAIRPVEAEVAGRRVPPPLVAHAAVAPTFRGGAPRPGAEPGARPEVPGAAVHPGAPGVPAERGLPPLAAPGARATAPQPQFRPAAPNAATPGGRPEVPGARPEVPGARPEVPGARPEVPGARPEVPGARPEVPGARPEVPGARPEVPGARPEVPGARPEVPGARPEVPGARPEVPGARPEAPGARPEAPRPAPALRPAPEAPRIEAARPAPAPRVEAPRPAPAPRVAAPRVEAPRIEAPRPAPAPRVEAPRPAPAPRPEAPRPEAARPAAHGEVRPPPK
jgi:hypothetical protein